MIFKQMLKQTPLLPIGAALFSLIIQGFSFLLFSVPFEWKFVSLFTGGLIFTVYIPWKFIQPHTPIMTLKSFLFGVVLRLFLMPMLIVFPLIKNLVNTKFFLIQITGCYILFQVTEVFWFLKLLNGGKFEKSNN